MKKFMSFFTGLLMVSCLVMSIGPTYAASKAGPKNELIIASYLPESIFISKAMKHFGDLVTQRTNGQVKCKYYWNASLADTKDTLPMITSGAIDVGFISTFYYPANFPLTSLFDVPFLSNHMDATQRAVDILYKEYPEFRAEFDRLNAKLLLTLVPDISPLGSNKKVERIEDIKGMRIRSGGNLAKAIEAWGGVPVSIGSGEIYQSMQSGMIDGFTAQPLQDFRPKGLDTVSKYCVDVGIGIYMAGFTLMNKDTFASFSPEVQKIIEQAATEANAISNTINMQNTKDAIPLVLKNRLQLYSVSENVKYELRSKAVPAVTQGWLAQAVKAGVNESTAQALLKRFSELCVDFDKNSTAMNYWEIYQKEFAKAQ